MVGTLGLSFIEKSSPLEEINSSKFIFIGGFIGVIIGSIIKSYCNKRNKKILNSN